MSYPTYPTQKQYNVPREPGMYAPQQHQFHAQQQQLPQNHLSSFGQVGQVAPGAHNYDDFTLFSHNEPFFEDGNNANVANWPVFTADTHVLESTATEHAPLTSTATGEEMQDDDDDIHAGLASYHQPRRRLNIKDDDHDKLIEQNKDYVRYIHFAILNTPAALEKDQAKINEILKNRKNALGKDADQHLRDLSSMCISAIWDLHSQGDYLYDAQFNSLHPRPEDMTMTATKRLEAIWNMLYKSKKFVVDLLDGGHDAIVRLVAAPNGAVYRKSRYKSNNDSRAQKLRQIQLQASNVAAPPLDDGDDEGNDEDDVKPPPKRRQRGRPRTRGDRITLTDDANEIADEEYAHNIFTGNTTTTGLVREGVAPPRKRRRAG